MSNPTGVPRVNANASFRSKNGPVPDAFWVQYYRTVHHYPADEAAEALVTARNAMRHVDHIKKFLVDVIGMEPRSGFKLPLDLVSRKLSMREGFKDDAMATTDGLGFRRRSNDALSVYQRFWDRLPSDSSGEDYDPALYYSVQRVRARTERTAVASGGASHTLGRFEAHYPRKGASATRPPLSVEVEAAMLSCGLDVSARHARLMASRVSYPGLEDLGLEEILGTSNDVPPLKLLEFDPAPGVRGVRTNPQASNGFPNLGKWTDDEDRALVWSLVNEIGPLVAAADADKNSSVSQWVDHAMVHRPHLVAVQGKCKTDPYPFEKLRLHQMRFYNVLPRHIALLMQQATQVLEDHSINCFDDPRLHTAQGISLVRDGADKLARVMQAQLDAHVLAEEGGPPTARRKVAYVHVGDDSWVVVQEGTGPLARVFMFALDCSSFDLTQLASVTEGIHKAVRDELKKIPGASPWANLWYKYMRERLTVLAGKATVLMRHGGPSGTPLQSKVNDLLMDIALRRVEARLGFEGRDYVPVLNEESVNALLEKLGEELHLRIRVEQFTTYDMFEGADLQPIRASLARYPFLFVGYYLYNTYRDEGVDKVFAYCDLPRSLAQLRYGGPFEPSDTLFKIKEAVRLASTLVNMGRPPKALKEAHKEARAKAMQLLALAVLDADKMEEGLADEPLNGERLDAARAVNMFADTAADSKSLRGLLGFMRSDGDTKLWDGTVAPVVPLPDDFEEFLAERAVGAAAVPTTEEQGLVEVRAPKPSRKLLVTARKGSKLTLVGGLTGVRPVTAANFGRTGSTSQSTNEQLLADKHRRRDARAADRDAATEAAASSRGARRELSKWQSEEDGAYAQAKGRRRGKKRN